MQVIPLSKARLKLEDVIDRVVEDCDVAIIARRGGPHAVIISMETFNRWLETVHRLNIPDDDPRDAGPMDPSGRES